MRDRNEPVDAGELDPGLFVQLAECGSVHRERLVRLKVVAQGACSDRREGVVQFSPVLRVDTAAREHVQSRSERHGGRAMDQEHLRSIGARAEEHDRRRKLRDGRFGIAHPGMGSASWTRSASGSVTGSRQAKSRQT